MKEHEIKISVTEDELNEILDAKMNNKSMSNAILSYARGSLKQFMNDNGFHKKFVNDLGNVLLEEIEAQFDYKKANGVIDIEGIIEFEELVTFYLCLSPKNLKLLTDKVGDPNLLKALKNKFGDI